MKALVDPGGGARDAPPRSNFFHFNAVFGKNLANRFLPQNQGLAPPPSVWEILDLPLEGSVHTDFSDARKWVEYSFLAMYANAIAKCERNISCL